MCRYLQAEENKDPPLDSEKVESEREDSPFDSEKVEDEQQFDFIAIARKLQGTASMKEYKLYMLCINEEQGKDNLQKIQTIIGDFAARMFYDKANETCVILCTKGAYYCGCTPNNTVEAFTKCSDKGKINTQQVSLQHDSIILTSMDEQKNYQQLEILLNRPYR